MTRRSVGNVPSSGRLAQLEERHVHTVEVMGSRPVSPTRSHLPAEGGLRFAPVGRQCDRPGCSAPGALVYRMVPERLVFWMAPLESEPDTDGGVICQRHADRLVVPRGWTLDDRRDPTLRLFRPPTETSPEQAPARRTSRRASVDSAEQLPLAGDRSDAVEEQPASVDAPDESDQRDQSATARPSWAPTSAQEEPESEIRSSLLARAFGLRRRG